MIKNLTPHILRYRTDASNDPIELPTDQVFPSQGRGFITTKSETELGPIDGIRCTEIEYGEVEGLGDPVAGITYIVSMPTAQFLAAQGRNEDIRYPDTGKPEFCIRKDGMPFATRRLLKAKLSS